MDRIKKDEYLAAAFCFALAFICIFISFSFFVFLAPLPFVLAYSVARGGYIKGAAASLAAFGCAYFLDAKYCIFISALFLPPAIAAGYSIRSKKRLFTSVLITSAGALAGASLMIFLTTLFSGVGFVDFVSASFAEQLKAQHSDVTLSLYYAARYPDIVSGAITEAAVASTTPAQAVEIMAGMVKDALNAALVSMIAIYSLLGGLLYYVIPRAVAKTNKMDVARISAFSDFALPKGFWIAAAVSYLAAALGAEFGLNGFDILQSSIFDIYAFVYAVQALSFFDFFYKKRNIKTVSRVFLHILIVLVFGYLISVVGLVENIASIRKHMDENGETD